MRFQNNTFENQDVELDGNDYIGCQILNCNLIYGGTGPVTLDGCSIIDCRLTFKDAAASAVNFMRQIYVGGWTTVIDATIDQIRGKSSPGDDDILNSGIIH